MKYFNEASYSTDKQVTKEFKVTANADVLKRFEAMLGLIARNSAVGHSAVCGIHVDGDGADRIKFTPKPEFPKEEQIMTRDGGYEQVDLKDVD